MHVIKCALKLRHGFGFVIDLTQIFLLSPHRPPSPDQDEGQITFDVEMPSPRDSQVNQHI